MNIEIKGPFSYSGNKYRIWKSTLSKIMSNYEHIHEPFLGSGACIYNSNKGGIGLDIDNNVVMLHLSLYDTDLLNRIKNAYHFSLH